MRIDSVDDCPYYLLTRAGLAVTSQLKRGFQEAGLFGVKPAYLGVLMSLWREDGLKAIELGRRAGLEPSTMTGLLDRMERDELVKREDDPEDRRAHRILLTDNGRDYEKRVMPVIDEILTRVLVGLDPHMVDELKKGLRIIMSNAREGDGT